MKFATIALMAVAMFSADAEAKKKRGITAKCNFPEPEEDSMVMLGDSEEDDAIKGGLYLAQRKRKDETYKYIGVNGRIWNGEKGEDYSALLFSDAECGGSADGDEFGLREKRGWKRSTLLRGGKIGEGDETQVLLTDQTDKSIALLNLAGDTVACCPITDIKDHSADAETADPVRLLEDIFDQN